MPSTILDESVPVTRTLSDAKRRLLAQRLNNAASAKRPLASIQPRSPGTAVLITPEQYSVWLASTLRPDLPIYNEAVTLTFNRDIDPSILELALNAFIGRHEIWRTTFSLLGGEAFQHIHPEITLSLQLVDLTHLPEPGREPESLRIARAQALTPLDIEHPPLIRATLVRLSACDARLHLVLHHLIFDGFSLRRTFVPELESLYSSLVSGTPSTLPPRTLQYADFASWHRLQLESPALATHLAFWRKQLAGPLPLAHLPLDRPRAATATHLGELFRFNLSRDLTLALTAVARAQGATLYMALLASLKAVLFRYSGQQDLIVGTVADGRRLPELECMMGYILNVFAVRTAPSADLPFAGYLHHVKHAVLESHEASVIPFERVVSVVNDQNLEAQATQPRRDVSPTPIFQTLFAFQPSDSATSTWQIANTQISLGVAKFDLYIEADELPAHTSLRIFYSTDLFDAPTIQRLAGHWTTIIEAVVQSPETALGDLPLLTPAERETMLVSWNQNAAPIPHQTMHGLFASQAGLTPDSPAVSFNATTLTYAQLDQQSSSLAHHLCRAGAGPGTLAAVLLDRSHHLVSGLLAILKTGAAYMPLDPGAPATRNALCLEDGSPAVILTSRALAASLPPTTAAILILEDLLATPGPHRPFHSPPAEPEALAYVIHTSGSTGRPKGVELRHRGVVNFLLSMQHEPGFTAADTLIALTTISFDIAVLELFLPLVTGGCVVVAPREVALDPTRLAALIESSHATVLQATPATWSALSSIDWRPSRPLKALSGGEALSRPLADRLLTLNLDLWNLYGPTETTIWSTLHRVQPGTRTASSVPVGRPIANTSAFILDFRLQPVPVNIPGELYLGGVGLARGYRNQPALTASRFIPNPFATGPSDSLLYRTGDLALFRSTGLIECQGRADNQVKIRGFRIELEDVEANLAAHPRVASAAARAWPDPSGGYFLCAYLVGVSGPPPTPAELRQFLRSRVADYMIPSDIVALPSMPLTSNGKIDRARLLPPARVPIGDAPCASSTLSPAELRLARLWSQLLHLPSIAATDNFFDLGGHSLLLLKLIRLIHQEFAVDLPVTHLFQAPTLQTLAASIELLARQPPAASCNLLSNSSGTVVALNTRGTRPPFFLIHSLMLYGRLPAVLGQDQPFYGLDTLPFDPRNSDTWVESMLEDHVAQIKRIQPSGPYHIAGWCFAGLMAYEVARRLEQRGDRVSTLALLDSWNPCRPPGSKLDASDHTRPAPSRSTRGSFANILWKMTFRARQLTGLSPAERPGYLRRMLRDHLKSTFVPLDRRAKSTLFRACKRLGLPLPRFLNDPWVVTYEWLGRYQLRPYSGDIALLRPASIAVPPTSDPDCGWREFTSGRISSTFIPGDRSTMFLQPSLATLAHHLRTLIDR